MYKRYQASAPGKVSVPYEGGAHLKNMFSGIKGEDILILGIIFVLLKEGKASKSLIFALWFIFLSEF